MNARGRPTSLLIYIPSYNRFDRLCEQIDQIYPFLNKYPINILVSDNSSSDPRYLTLKERYPGEQVSIITNTVNIGANPNIINGFLYSAGYDYLWILSDDDIISENAVDKIMDLLGGNYDILYFMKKNVNPSVKECKMSDILTILNFGLGLISAIIYDSETISKDIKNGYEYISSGFPHLAVLFASCNRKGSLTIMQYSYDEIFIKKTPDPSVEVTNYYLSTFGFPQLSDFITDKKLKIAFIKMWIFDILPLAIKLRDTNLTRYNNIKGYIFAQSLWLRIYFYYRVTVIFFIRNIMRFWVVCQK